MPDSKIKISAVSYSNTLPFIYGIEQSGLIDKIDLQLDIPSACAKKLLENNVDVGLVPVAIIPELKEHFIISDYCIGTKGKVNSVLLLSDVPLNEIEEVQLDYQSRTSVNLVRILSKKYWKITPNFVSSQPGFEENIKGKVAGVIIGDRTFHLKKDYSYQYDLSEEWNKYTGLPFAFACWVSNKVLPGNFIKELNKAFKEGVGRISEVIDGQVNMVVSKERLKSYLENDIDYILDDKKRAAIQLFHQYMKELN